MSTSSSVLNKTVIVTASVIGLALVASVGLGVWGYVHTKDSAQNMIEITGKAERSIVSDKAKWTVSFAASGESADEAKKTLEQAKDALKKAVSEAGVTDAVYSFQALQAYDAYRSEYDNYNAKAQASQSVVIESANVGAIGELNQSFGGGLSVKNATAYSQSIEFSYSKKNQLEQELTEEAVANARAQAQKLVGKNLGKIIRINQSSMVLSAENTDYSYSEDRFSINKTAKLRINVVFSTR